MTERELRILLNDMSLEEKVGQMVPAAWRQLTGLLRL